MNGWTKRNACSSRSWPPVRSGAPRPSPWRRWARSALRGDELARCHRTTDPRRRVEQPHRAAQAWWAVGSQPNTLDARQRAVQLIDGVTATPDAPAGAWFLRGLIGESDGDLSAAAAGYRQALRRDPSLPAAKNNLAMVLAQQDSGLDEALGLRGKRSMPCLQTPITSTPSRSSPPAPANTTQP